MATELMAFAEVWLAAYASLIYCYAISKFVGKGIPRFAAVAPVVCLFLALPLGLSSVHLCGFTAFFLAWLANFKLLLFAFGQGPLSSAEDLSLLRFIAVACLPIKIHRGKSKDKKSGRKSTLNYAVKGLILSALVRAHDYTSERLILVVYSFHIYLCLEIILAAAAALAQAALGLELEAQFDEPYLSTSLQDFWGRRWNVTVTRILRPTVYDPVLSAAARHVGRQWAAFPAVVATFAVSGLMHELMFYYFGRLRPTGEITCFFLVHGFALVGEIALKRVVGRRFRLPRAVTGPMTVAFVMATTFWLFFPPLLRSHADVRAFEEYAALGAFFRNVGRAFRLKNVIAATSS